MLQLLYTYVANICPNISSVFSDVCCKCVYLDVVYISHIYCKYFIWMFAWYSIVFTSILDACFKCSNCFFYVASFASRCFKSRSGVTHGMCGK
jgi:hypothetical protein